MNTRHYWRFSPRHLWKYRWVTSLMYKCATLISMRLMTFKMCECNFGERRQNILVKDWDRPRQKMRRDGQEDRTGIHCSVFKSLYFFVIIWHSYPWQCTHCHVMSKNGDTIFLLELQNSCWSAKAASRRCCWRYIKYYFTRNKFTFHFLSDVHTNW